jgi:hypothetical protein
MIRKHSYKKRRSYKKGKSTRKISRRKINKKYQLGGSVAVTTSNILITDKAKIKYYTVLNERKQGLGMFNAPKMLHNYGNTEIKFPNEGINRQPYSKNNTLFDYITIANDYKEDTTSYEYKIENIKKISGVISPTDYAGYFCRLHEYYITPLKYNDSIKKYEKEIYIVSDSYDLTLHDIFFQKNTNDNVAETRAAAVKAREEYYADLSNPDKVDANDVAEAAAEAAIEAAAKYPTINITNITKEQIYTWFLNIAQGIKRMHDVDYVHLDINLSNIVINLLKSEFKGSNAKLSNFGYAIESSKKLNASIYNKDDPSFMAPELDDTTDKFVDYKKCDIYSLGSVFGELLYTLYPIDDMDESNTPLTESGLDAMVEDDINSRLNISAVIDILTPYVKSLPNTDL